jgi:O-acetyl-ADP-ribose deacetylase (regulator of RNase III)
VVAFPSISTGVYGYPVERAAAVALSTIRDVLRDRHEAFDEVRMVLFSDDDFAVYRAALDAMD